MDVALEIAVTTLLVIVFVIGLGSLLLLVLTVLARLFGRGRGEE